MESRGVVSQRCDRAGGASLALGAHNLVSARIRVRWFGRSRHAPNGAGDWQALSCVRAKKDEPQRWDGGRLGVVDRTGTTAAHKRRYRGEFTQEDVDSRRDIQRARDGG